MVEPMGSASCQMTGVDDFGEIITSGSKGFGLLLLVGWCFLTSQVLECFGTGYMVDVDWVVVFVFDLEWV